MLTPWLQGRGEGRVPGVPEPPIWVMKMDIISRGKKYRNPPFEIPREDIFVFKEKQKKSNLKRHHMLYRRLQYYMAHKLDGSYEPPVYKPAMWESALFWPPFQLCARRDWFDAILKWSGQRRGMDRLAMGIRIARKHPRRLLLSDILAE